MQHLEFNIIDPKFEIKCRHALDQDLHAILDLMDLARSYMALKGNPHQWDAGYPGAEIILSDIKEQAGYVLEDREHKIVAYFALYDYDKAYDKVYGGKWLNDEPYVCVHRLATMQEQGLGTLILKMLQKNFANIRMDTMNVNKPMRHLMEKLNANGFLAVQMPYNNDEPLYCVINEVVSEPKWGFDCAKFENNITLDANEYYKILSECSSDFDIWETKYYHSMPDHMALIEWVKSTKLRPYLAFLGEEKGKELEEEILKRAKKHYPIQSDGNILFGFRRLFFIAKKS